MDAEMDSVITNTGVSGSTLMKQEEPTKIGVQRKVLHKQADESQRQMLEFIMSLQFPFQFRDGEVTLVSCVLTLMPEMSSEPVSMQRAALRCPCIAPSAAAK
ncbi:hypothetical protein T03_16096 [Trichinella britovi]|uniref:Uncharacterized protein n=1 Tax=Trichinella britovi TaxID=45882 RepID=A0A0V1BHW3_TRIBR|nr:hypothetical protein T03_12182 [Trichinella britovi]KRY45386.1 hypothetical protein T03_16096 [Trichinella britovi]